MNKFQNIGRKLQGAGKVILIAGIVLSIALWIILMNINWNMDIMDQAYGYNIPYVIAAWVSLIIGPFMALLSCWILKGFGIMVENVEMASTKVSGGEPLPAPARKTGSDIL